MPVFEAARLNNFELLALNADSEDLGVVEMSGLAGLPNTTLAKYIPDRRVFADFTQHDRFPGVHRVCGRTLVQVTQRNGNIEANYLVDND